MVKSLWLLALSSCAGGDFGDPCELCGLGEVCYEAPDIRRCAPTCSSDASCTPGHACVADLDDQVCDPHCTDSLCGDREACRGLDCVPVDCGATVACESAMDVCDVFAHACYPFDGSCNGAPDCPVFDGSIQNRASIGCDLGFCSVELQPPPFPPFVTSNIQELIMTSPSHGESLESQDDLRIQWNIGSSGTAFALILNGTPANAQDIQTMTIWGAAAIVGTSGALTLADGGAVIDGTWTDHPFDLPTGAPLTLFVEILHEGTVLATSRMVRFRIGGAWPQPGDTCNDVGVLAGECENPAVLLGCDPATSHCAKVCESYRDCLDVGLDCGAPRSNARYCE